MKQSPLVLSYYLDTRSKVSHDSCSPDIDSDMVLRESKFLCAYCSSGLSKTKVQVKSVNLVFWSPNTTYAPLSIIKIMR